LELAHRDERHNTKPPESDKLSSAMEEKNKKKDARGMKGEAMNR
jgi:hypothetical protein